MEELGSAAAPSPALSSRLNLWPTTLALGALLWIVATSGGHQVFVKEILGEAFDSQAEHFLRGDPGIDGEAIRSEAFVVAGKARMYFGPFPALVRIPLHVIYPAGRGRWSRLSGFCGSLIALIAMSGLLREALARSAFSSTTRNWLANVCLAGFALGSPLLFLIGNVSIYNEPIIWGLAWSLAALYFVSRRLDQRADDTSLTRSLLAFSGCAAAALLSRVTFGLPLLLIAFMLAFRLPQKRTLSSLAALLLPLGVGLAFYIALSYARFGNLTGVNFDTYIDPAHREFVHKYGTFNLNRVPYSLADYFFLRFPSFDVRAPFLIADRHFFSHPTLYTMPFSETYLSVLWCSPWLLVGAGIGLLYLLRSKKTDQLERWIAAALFVQVIVISSFFSLAQRYAVDLYPFLIFCLVIFLSRAKNARIGLAMAALVAISILTNWLSTASWLGRDGSLPPETRIFWNGIAGSSPLAPKN